MNRGEEINKEIEALEEILESRDDEFRGIYDQKDPQKSWEAYCDKRKPYTSKIAKLGRELRLIVEPKPMEKVEEGDDVMSIEEFIANVEGGGFIDYDGFGRYVRDGIEYNVEIYPSDVKHNAVRKDFDTIVWYNR